MIARFCNLSVTTLVVGLTLAGCGSADKEQPADPGHGEAGHDEHAHPTTGPHGGSLIELGNEEYHAELVHDDAAGTVTIYVLDSAAKASVPIDATDVTINLTHDGQGEQFKLTASADQGDPTGKSSRFVSSDAELAKDLDREDAAPQLVITINGKPFRGAVEHEHEAEGDDRASK
ncbi:MAG: hypothetical protein WD851_16020 [Pirellulales bacterium]